MADNNELDRLKFLQEISASVATVFNFDALLRIVIEKILKIMNCSRCSIVLLDDKNIPFIKLGKGFDTSGFIENEKIKKAGSVTQKVLNSLCSVIDQERNFMCVPIINDNRALGIINVTERNNKQPFTENEKNLMEILSTQIGHAIENIRFHKNIVQMEKISREMDLARKFQEKIVCSLDNYKNIKMYSFYRTAFEVGGDYFKIFPIDNDNFMFCIGDVSGKGIYASMTMVIVHSLISAYLDRGIDFKVSDFVKDLNKMLYKEIGNETTFITLFTGIFNTKKREIQYVNAGHNYPFLISDKKVNNLKSGGIFLGSFNNEEFTVEKCNWKEGDVLVLYSDGAIEYNSSRDNYINEKERFENVVVSHTKLEPEFIMEKIFEEYYDFRKKDIDDDVSLVVMKF
ncbi:MAG: SpoIIE family protein phosphatase [Candidatus Muirbacterium halophilum]|nr:SpoIIE family protein phosphatase [Candidatus Muirbacterium halophilum]MCK9475677.1 SpoIIE family protein phosphatase [Candidatus Muirbacterium halophilum]